MASYSISLFELLDAKERRVEKRDKLLAKHNGSALSVLLNIPGSVKDSEEYRRAFDISLEDIKELLSYLRIKIIIEWVSYYKTGPEAIFILDTKATYLKRKMIEIETNHPLGRILDLDVYENNGEQLSRVNFNQNNRKCLLCDDNAKICSRIQKHDVNDLLSEINKIISDLSS